MTVDLPSVDFDLPAAYRDANTGRVIRPIAPTYCATFYFRRPCHLPDGRVVLNATVDDCAALAVLAPGEPRARILSSRDGGQFLRLRVDDGVAFGIRAGEILAVNLLTGARESLCRLPAELPGAVVDLNSDGTCALIAERHQDPTAKLNAADPDPAELWRWLRRPRHGALWACRLADGHLTKLHDAPDYHTDHVDTHPRDPGTVRFCTDRAEAFHQRMYAIGLDGANLRPIRPQAPGEVVTHEFWWADPAYIGYTYQDRRQDHTVDTIPWAEYAPAATRLGIADTATGREVYLSDPLNSYHQHLYCNADGSIVTGDGVDGNQFIYAAPFDMANPRIELQAFATTYTPYLPFTGQRINLQTTPDSSLLFYTDECAGERMVLATELRF